ncbi:MAG TPA: phytanoyl-CoA dioxygenase family protein [Caulobacteraceae bacterium]|jgi:ectoine hydroxylase-related dioxygenase (phytanoyl-CoA dioxygenase family)|nr:phytanoyl-CoA dioxygenase family protein [Caulobacteraceae bacterium]
MQPGAFDPAPHLARMARDGFTIVEGVLDGAGLSEFRQALSPFLGTHSGRNPFEGRATERVYTLVARGTIFEQLAEDPAILALVGAHLRPGFLLSASHAIDISPGEAAQSLHFDDSFYPFPRPRAPLGVSIIGAIDDFTAQNGATVAIPGSHLWGEDWRERTAGAPRTCLAMPAGAVAVLAGTLIHGAGANQTRAHRLAFTNQYCEPWARTQENFFLAVPRERAARMTATLQALLGYSLMAPFMGQVTGSHPAKALAADWTAPVERQKRTNAQ